MSLLVPKDQHRLRWHRSVITNRLRQVGGSVVRRVNRNRVSPTRHRHSVRIHKQSSEIWSAAATVLSRTSRGRQLGLSGHYPCAGGDLTSGNVGPRSRCSPWSERMSLLVPKDQHRLRSFGQSSLTIPSGWRFLLFVAVLQTVTCHDVTARVSASQQSSRDLVNSKRRPRFELGEKTGGTRRHLGLETGKHSVSKLDTAQGGWGGAGGAAGALGSKLGLSWSSLKRHTQFSARGSTVSGWSNWDGTRSGARRGAGGCTRRLLSSELGRELGSAGDLSSVLEKHSVCRSSEHRVRGS
jgi:hypothetical protein